jgi:hypothetical protein
MQKAISATAMRNIAGSTKRQATRVDAALRPRVKMSPLPTSFYQNGILPIFWSDVWFFVQLEKGGNS